MTDTARQYALAVFSLAKDKKEIDSFQKSLKSFIESLTEKDHLFFEHPRFSKQEKKSVIEKLNLTPLLTNFLNVLIDNERFEELSSIYYAYKDIVIHQDDLLNVLVYSKTKLSEQEKIRIVQKLEKDYSRKVIMTEMIDKTIIAGYRLEFEGYEIDDTVSRRLSDMVKNLKKN